MQQHANFASCFLASHWSTDIVFGGVGLFYCCSEVVWLIVLCLMLVMLRLLQSVSAPQGRAQLKFWCTDDQWCWWSDSVCHTFWASPTFCIPFGAVSAVFHFFTTFRKKIRPGACWPAGLLRRPACGICMSMACLLKVMLLGFASKASRPQNPPGLKFGHWKLILHHGGASFEGTGNHNWEWCYLQTLNYMAIQRQGAQTNLGYLVPAQFV